MKSAVFLYNTQSGKCKIGHCTDSICTVFRAYGYEITPQPIDFEANPFDGNEQISLMVVAGGDGTVNYVVNSMKSKGLDIPLGVIHTWMAYDFEKSLGNGNMAQMIRSRSRIDTFFGQVEGEEADPDYFGRDTGDASKDDSRNQDDIGENELLVVSFGTSFNDSRAADIKGISASWSWSRMTCRPR